MILNKSKSNRKDRGFTIVELLVVIVVIGILAAITIVSYIGFTARAKSSQAQSNANSAMQVISAYTADASGTPNFGGNGTFPTNVLAMASYTQTKMPASVLLLDAAQNKPDNNEGTTTVRYKALGSTGGCIGWWDYSAATPAIRYIFIGAAVGADFTAAPPTCT